jgi:hypothetical protein
MTVTSVRKTNSTVDSIVVHIANVTNESVSQIRTLAYHAAGETPQSCFGATIHKYDDETVVYIHRD